MKTLVIKEGQKIENRNDFNTVVEFNKKHATKALTTKQVNSLEAYLNREQRKEKNASLPAIVKSIVDSSKVATSKLKFLAGITSKNKLDYSNKILSLMSLEDVVKATFSKGITGAFMYSFSKIERLIDSPKFYSLTSDQCDEIQANSILIQGVQKSFLNGELNVVEFISKMTSLETNGCFNCLEIEKKRVKDISLNYARLISQIAPELAKNSGFNDLIETAETERKIKTVKKAKELLETHFKIEENA